MKNLKKLILIKKKKLTTVYLPRVVVVKLSLLFDSC